jgi:hypothetical protein
MCSELRAARRARDDLDRLHGDLDANDHLDRTRAAYDRVAAR